MAKRSISLIATIALTSMVGFSALMYSDEADARRYGGGSSFKSSSSFKSRSASSKTVKSSWTKPKAKSASSSKNTSTKVSKQTYTKPKSKFGAAVKQKQRVAKSRSEFKEQKAAFKPRPKSSLTSSRSNRTKYSNSNNRLIKSSTKYDRTTYYTRRGNYYGNWSTPTYAYSGFSSYGMWDSLALWFMLDHIADSQYQKMYYHQMNTDGMKQWKSEAEKLAATNTELRAKLNALDASVSKLESQGVERDPSYLPKSADADILLSAEVRDATKPVMRVCTGATNNNYYGVANLLNDNEYVELQPIVTNGSAENLEKLDAGQCDAAFVQRDSYWIHAANNPDTTLDYERVMSPYNEVVHLVCSKDSGVSRLSELKQSHTVAIGKDGSGTQLTWSNAVDVDERLEKVKTVNVGGTDAKALLDTGKASCLLSISGVNSSFMKALDDDSTRLAEWDQYSITSTTDPSGAEVYATYELKGDTYKTLTKDTFMWLPYRDDKSLITVPADFIVSNKWISQNDSVYKPFVSYANTKSTDIISYVGNK